jgi:hypothetical protein
MKLIRQILLIVLFSWCFNSYSQEIRGLNFNASVKAEASKPRLKSTSISVPLPAGNIFFDDFSVYKNLIYPESENWLDRNAIITRTYADSAISIGVVTLDCFDSEGRVYGPTGKINPSDTLTSKKILSITESNLFMSFFIEGGGKADPPEVQDSLVLEFYNSESEEWIFAWDTNGYQSHTFTQIILPIPENLYSDSSFQFRFINYTSLSANEVQGKEGALSNADNWHIDYIQIKSETSANNMKLLNDVAIYEPLLPVFKDYSLIPYSHIQYSAGYLRQYNTLRFRTYFPADSNSVSINRFHSYYDVINNMTLEEAEGETQSTEEPFAFIETTDNFFPVFNTSNYPGQTFGKYLLKSYLDIPDESDQYLYNDTVTREEIFEDFYAYDDGSAEYGFGIAGVDAYEAAFATLFEMYHLQGAPDTLTGVYIYFNMSADLYNSDLDFRVAVWKDNGSTPGESIYMSDENNLFTPDTTKTFNNPGNGTNGFMRINFESDVLVPEMFYVGLIQYTTEFLNVGYDVNFGSKKNMMYYTDNQWHPGTGLANIPEGSLMIRPIFDHVDYTTGIHSPKESQNLSISVYPNPVRDEFTVNLTDIDLGSYTYTLSDIIGRQVAGDRLHSNTIDVSYLPHGMYILHIQDQTSRTTYSQKILKID